MSKLNQETSHKTAELERIHAQVIEKQQIAQNLNQQLGKYESFLVEFNSLKANYQRNQSENQAIMAKLAENQAKYEESNLRLTLQDQNLLSLKRHIEGLSQQAREKERELSDLDQKIREKELVLQDFQRKEAEYSSLVGNFDEFMRQKTAKEEELRNCEKILAVKEIQLNSLNNEINEKFGDLEGLQATISENQTSYKSVLKENKEVLEKIKDELSRKSIEARGLTERVEALTEKARVLAESVKTSEETLFNSQKKEVELKTECQRLKEKLSDMQTDEAKTGKRIEKARMMERDLCERIEEMERYIDELRREKQAFVEKQAEIKRKEDELYVLMALKGEIPDQKVFERIREMTEAYYLYQKTKSSDTVGNTMNSNESPTKGKKVIVKINSPAIGKQQQHSSLMKSPASSAKLRGRDSEENENSGGSTNQKKGELSMKIFEAEKEISNMKKKLEAQELS